MVILTSLGHESERLAYAPLLRSVKSAWLFTLEKHFTSLYVLVRKSMTALRRPDRA